MCQNCYKMTFTVPLSRWEDVKSRILSIDFLTSEPTLTKHAPTAEQQSATFAANHLQDMDVVARIVNSNF